MRTRLLAGGAVITGMCLMQCAPAVDGQTHIGRSAEEHVTLGLVRGMAEGCGRPLYDFVRILPDGSSLKGGDGLGYRIPADRNLIVTDVDWQYTHPKRAEAAGKTQVLRLFVQNRSDRTEQARVFESTVTLSSQGEGGASERMTTGFVISSAARICPEVVPGPDGPPSGLLHMILRGYFIPATAP
ncbi:MAG: hypothetical protein GF418_09270 [Chitinivibrionales bacterium]|nr:hypothetical protein [Chitinivibrionales bacterium]MBD3395798.1 hypothetical protein [Chitinivibrionales bacterium]